MEPKSDGGKPGLEGVMETYLLKRVMKGRYSILDFHSQQPAEVIRGDGTVYRAKLLDHSQLGAAMADLYRSLCLPDKLLGHTSGICFVREESETDPVLEALIQISRGINELYQCRPKPQVPLPECMRRSTPPPR